MNYDFNVVAFTFGVAAILVTPGPTNTILAAAGLAQGVRLALPLIVVELFGYLVGISVWGIFLASAQHYYPWSANAVRIASSCYLLYVAAKLWTAARMHLMVEQSAIRSTTLFVATVLNPKGLLFASTIFPAQAFEDIQIYLAAMALFSCILLPVGLAWIKFGAVLGGKRLINPAKLQRVAAMVVGIFSASIAWTAFH